MIYSKAIYLQILIISILALLSFQNCSKSTLEKMPYIEQIRYQKINASICLDKDNANYTLESAIPISLGLKMDRNNLKPDSDFDGLSDDEEDLYGFDKYNQRTSGGILDSICFRFTNSNNCSNLTLTCQHKHIMFGLEDCDTEVAGIDFIANSSNAGLDSDKDGIIDFIEIIRGTNPLVSDAFADPDNDQRTNLDEIIEGGDLLHYDKVIPESHNPQFSSAKVNDKLCQGEMWKIKIDKLPWYPSKENITDNTEQKLFTIKSGQSMALITLKLQPLDLSVKTSKILISTLILDGTAEEINLNQDDFTLLGEVPK